MQSWEYILWTIIVLSGLYVVIRFVIAQFLKKDKYKG